MNILHNGLKQMAKIVLCLKRIRIFISCKDWQKERYSEVYHNSTFYLLLEEGNIISLAATYNCADSG